MSTSPSTALARESLGVLTFRNAIWRLISGSWRLALMLVTTPFIVRGLGDESYGILTIASTFVGYFVILDLDLGVAVTKYVAEYKALGDSDSARRVVATSMFFYLVIGLLVALALVGLSGFLVDNVLNVSPERRDATKLALSLAGVGFGVMMPTWIYIGVLQALNRFDLLSKIGLIVGSLGPIGFAVLASLGFGLEQILLWNLAWLVINFLVHFIVVRRIYLPAITLPRFHGGTARTVWSFSSISFVGKLLGTVWFQSDKLLIASILSASALAYYAVPWRLAALLIGSVAGLVLALVLPLASQLHSVNESDRLRRMYLQSSRLSLVTALSLAMPLFVFGDAILGIWVGPAFGTRGGQVLRILVICFVFIALSASANSTGAGMGRPSLQAWFQSGLAFFSLSLGALFIRRFGIEGVALAFTIPYVVLAPFYLQKVNRLTGIAGRDYLMGVVPRPIITGVSVGLVSWLFIRPWAATFLELAISVVISEVLFLAVAMLTHAFSREDRQLVRMALRRRLLPAISTDSYS